MYPREEKIQTRWVYKAKVGRSENKICGFSHQFPQMSVMYQQRGKSQKWISVDSLLHVLHVVG